MKKFALAWLTGAWLLCAACGRHPQTSSTPTTDTLSRPDTAGTVFFPVADVIESEILQIDTIPVAIRKSITGNGHTDSGFIKPAEFHALAMQFVVPEFRNGQFQKDFTETSFIDNATRAATFTYSPTSRDLPLTRVDVVATPHGAEHEMKTIYMERTRVSGDK